LTIGCTRYPQIPLIWSDWNYDRFIFCEGGEVSSLYKTQWIWQ
jgi:hypothetical protein